MIKFLFPAVLYLVTVFFAIDFLFTARGNVIEYTHSHNIDEAIKLIYNIACGVSAGMLNLGTLLMYLISSVNNPNTVVDSTKVSEIESVS